MRALTDSMIAQLTGRQVKPLLLVQIAFADDTVYMWSGLGDLSWNGHTWKGMGMLGAVSPITETMDVSAQNVTLTLSGIPPELQGEALDQVRQNSAATVWFGFLDDNNQVIADPSRSFQGHLDVPTATDGAGSCTVSVTVENPLVDLNRAPNRRFTDCDQQLDYPGDLGFSLVGALQSINLHWPFVL